MEITGTNNSLLARELPLSVSYISRLRSGERKLPEDPHFLDSLVHFFSREMNSEIWIQSELPCTETELAKWLSDDKLPLVRKNENIEDCKIFFGDRGKQKAIQLLFEKTLASNSSKSIYIYSNENLDWFFEYKEYHSNIKKLLLQLMEKNKIVIIHDFHRLPSELFPAVEFWLPLYRYGKIESYICPIARDGLITQTLVVSPGIGVVRSNSVQNQTENMAIYYFDSIPAVDSSFEEYQNLKKNCKKIICATSDDNKRDFFDLKKKFKQSEDILINFGSNSDLANDNYKKRIDILFENDLKNPDTVDKIISEIKNNPNYNATFISNISDISCLQIKESQGIIVSDKFFIKEDSLIRLMISFIYYIFSSNPFSEEGKKMGISSFIMRKSID